MKDQLISLMITEAQRDNLIEQISNLMKDNLKLQQNLHQNQMIQQADEEKLYLEILEVFDAIDFLCNFFKQNDQLQEQGFKRINQNLLTIEKKILNLLEQRGVVPIKLEQKIADFKLCRVLDQEIRADLAENTIVKVIRQGFFFHEQILRPMEVIIAVKSQSTN